MTRASFTLVPAKTLPLVVAALTFVSVKAADVTIDPRTVHQRIEGFGTSECVFDDPHIFGNRVDANTGRAAVVLTTAQQDAVLDELYLSLKLTRVRPAQPDTSAGAPPPGPLPVEMTNDNADPNVIDWSKFDFSWKRLDAHIDYVTRARSRGLDTWYLSPVFRESWMGATTTNDAAEYAEWLLAQALRCQALGVTLPFLSVANEPSYSRNTLSAVFIRDVIKILGPKLRAAGMSTQFVLPDDVRSTDAAAKTQTVLSDSVARSYVGALATHLYDESITNVAKMRVLADQFGLPLWMTEFTPSLAGTAGIGSGPFDWGGLMHEMLANYNVTAFDILWGYGGNAGADTLISLNYDGSLKYTGFTRQKIFYVTGQYSRFIRPGAFRVRADSTGATIKVTAYVDWPQLTIVAFNSNTSGNPVVTFNLTALPPVSAVTPVRTSGAENWATLSALAITNSAFSATLPHQSITTFTATLPPLLLNAALSNNFVTLTWPVAAAGFVLESADQLSASNVWMTISNFSTVVGNQRVITLVPSDTNQFFSPQKNLTKGTT